MKTELRLNLRQDIFWNFWHPKQRYYLETLKQNITEYKNGGNVPHLEITEIVLVHCNIVNNDYQQDSRVLYTIVPNKSFDQLLDISPKIFLFLKIFDSEFF